MKSRGLILNDSDGGGIRRGGWENSDAPITSKTAKPQKKSQGNGGTRIRTVEEMEATLAENIRTNKFGFDDWTKEQWEEAWRNR